MLVYIYISVWIYLPFILHLYIYYKETITANKFKEEEFYKDNKEKINEQELNKEKWKERLIRTKWDENIGCIKLKDWKSFDQYFNKYYTSSMYTTNGFQIIKSTNLYKIYDVTFHEIKDGL